MIGRAVTLAALIALVALVACGDEGDTDRTIAFVRSVAASDSAAAGQAAFLDELAAAGWEVGDNLTLVNAERDAATPDAGRARAAIEAFAEDGADVIVALGTTPATAAREADIDVPIVAIANDPVASGLVADPRAPEGNLTGVSFRVPPDRTLLLARQVGGGAPVGLIYAAGDPGAQPVVASLRSAAPALDVEIVECAFATPDGVAAAVEELEASGAGVAVVVSSAAASQALDAIEAATRAARLPVVATASSTSFAVVALGPNTEAVYRQLARQTARLLDGADVADVPLEDPGDFDLVVRPSVAAALGVDLPEGLLAQADQVE